MAAVLNCLPADTQFLWDAAWVSRALVAHWSPQSCAKVARQRRSNFQMTGRRAPVFYTY